MAAARSAAAERRIDPRRLALSAGLLLLAGLVGAAITLGVRELAFSSGEHTTTVSLVPKQPPFDLKKLLQLQDGSTLNDISVILIGAHRYKDARPFAQKAYRRTTKNPTHAFATFNLGYVLFKLGGCDKGIALMQKALPNEPKVWRPAVRNRIKAAKKRCGRS